MKNGEIRPGPRSSRILWVRSMSGRPPMPEPTIAPTRSPSKPESRNPESSSAIWLAATP